MDDEHKRTENDVVLGFGKGAAFVLAAYFAIKVFGVALDDNWSLLGTNYGLWFLLEMIGFVLLPCFLYLVGVRDRNVKLIRWTAALTVLGIVLNRLNICLIAFNWQLPAAERYFPQLDGDRHFRLRGHGGCDGLPVHRDADAGVLRAPGVQGKPLSWRRHHE